MSKLLAVDLDGTLFWPKQLFRRISKKNVKFLQSWIDQGNKVVIITSRSYEFTEKLLYEIKRDVDFINYNGGQIRVDGVLVKDSPLNNSDLFDVLTGIKAKQKTLSFMITSEKYPVVLRDNVGLSGFMSKFYAFWYWFQGKYKENYILDNRVFDDEVLNGKVYISRIFFGIRKKKKLLAKEVNKTLRTKYPQMELSWSELSIEITPKDSNKADALSYYISKANFNKNDVYVVGDSGNDITMFAKFHKHSYCMAHAYPSVKKYAKNVISRVYNLDKLLLKGEK